MAEYSGSILRDFYQFLQHPKREIERLPLTFNSFVRLLGVHYLVLLIAAVTYGIGSTLFKTEELDHSIQDLFGESSTLLFLFLVAIAAPIIEELIFRFPLKYRRGSLFLGLLFLTLFVYLICASLLPDTFASLLAEETMTEMVEETIQEPHVLASIISMVTFCIGLLWISIISFSQKFLEKSTSIVRGLFPYIFYLTAVLFGYMHIMNFSGAMEWYWAPLLTLPQFSMGLTLGYGRLRFGLLASILLHGVNNLIPSIMLLMGSQMGI